MVNESQKKVIDFLLLLIKKPGLFGVNKVEDINFIWIGYNFANGDVSLGSLLTDFRLFVNKDFDTVNEDHDWFKLIRLYSGSDKHSLELFGKLFYEYLESIGLVFEM